MIHLFAEMLEHRRRTPSRVVGAVTSGAGRYGSKEERGEEDVKRARAARGPPRALHEERASNRRHESTFRRSGGNAKERAELLESMRRIALARKSRERRRSFLVTHIATAAGVRDQRERAAAIGSLTFTAGSAAAFAATTFRRGVLLAAAAPPATAALGDVSRSRHPAMVTRRRGERAESRQSEHQHPDRRAPHEWGRRPVDSTHRYH